MSLAIDVQYGSEGTREVQLAPLNPKVHAVLAAVATGVRVRLVGLWARADSSLVPTPRTVLARVDDLPVLASAASVSTEKSESPPP